MTGTMSMNQIIHAAVRRDVARTERALRGMRDGDAERARQIQTAWRNLVRELTHHHEAEDEHLWPFLRSRGVEVMGEPVASRNASEGQRWVYFRAPWGMQFELVSFPQGKAYEADAPVLLWHPAHPEA